MMLKKVLSPYSPINTIVLTTAKKDVLALLVEIREDINATKDFVNLFSVFLNGCCHDQSNSAGRVWKSVTITITDVFNGGKNI